MIIQFLFIIFVILIYLLFTRLYYLDKKSISTSKQKTKYEVIKLQEIVKMMSCRIKEFSEIFLINNLDVSSQVKSNQFSSDSLISKAFDINVPIIKKHNINFFTISDNLEFEICISRMIFEKLFNSLMYIIVNLGIKNSFIKIKFYIEAEILCIEIQDNGLDLPFSYLDEKDSSDEKKIIFYSWLELKDVIENHQGLISSVRDNNLRKTLLKLPLNRELNTKNVIYFKN